MVSHAASPASTGGLANAILDFIGSVPTSDEPRHRDPVGRARRIGQSVKAKAALASGTLALPPGPLGWLTLLPELRTVWQQQAQMVADIAAAHGRHAELNREVMLYCLFRHIAPAAFARVVQRQTNGRFLIRPASAQVLRGIALKIAARVSLRLAGRGATRWLPIVGAVGVGIFSWYDTGRVAATAEALFQHPFETSLEGVGAGDMVEDEAAPA
jgi:hypothetical protein